MTEGLLDRWLFGYWYRVCFWPLDVSRKWKSKPLRALAASSSFVWFLILTPITFLGMMVLGAIDLWRSA